MPCIWSGMTWRQKLTTGAHIYLGPPCDLGFLTSWHLKQSFHMVAQGSKEECSSKRHLFWSSLRSHKVALFTGHYWLKQSHAWQDSKRERGDVDPHLSMEVSKNLQPCSNITTVMHSLMTFIGLHKICTVPRKPRACWLQQNNDGTWNWWFGTMNYSTPLPT